MSSDSAIKPPCEFTRLRVLALALQGSSVIGLAVCLIAAFVPEEHDSSVPLMASAILWTISAAIAIRRPPIINLFLIAVGLSWGFLITISILISIQNARLSISWGPFLAGLFALPLGVVASVMPFWLLGKRILSAYTLGIVPIGLVILILGARFDFLPYVYKGPTAPPGKYDVAAWAVEFSPNPGKVGGLLGYSYTVKNVGPTTIPAGTFDVELYIDGRKESFNRRPSELKPGEVNTVSGPPQKLLKASDEGTHPYKLIVDPRGRLEEIDKKNNILEGSFTVVR